MLRKVLTTLGLFSIVSSIFLSGHYTAEAQNIPIPEFAPNTRVSAGSEGHDSAQSETETERPRPTAFAMKVQLEPH